MKKALSFLAVVLIGLLNVSVYADVSVPASDSLWGMQNKEEEINDLVRLVRERGIDFIDLNFTDILGNMKTYTITSSMFSSALKKGVFFDGSSVAGYSDLASSDLRIVPDISTFRVLPWSQGGQSMASMICDIYGADGKPYENSPRFMLRKACYKAQEKGFAFFVSPEIEFFLLKQDQNDHKKLINVDSDGYCAAPSMAQIQAIKLHMLKSLDLLGLEPEKTHHEVARDQHEITLKYGHALELADRLIIAKWIMQFIARNSGYEVCFIPKYFSNENGNGMHINFSLYDIEKGENAFYDAQGQFNLSEIAKKFIAGNLKHVSAMTALFNPGVNSYKRLVPGYEAPVYIAWGHRNRSTLIRIPITVDGTPQTVRGELRSPDPLANPYLVFTALLESGLKGLETSDMPIKPVSDNLFKLNKSEIEARGIACLPANLNIALEEMNASKFIHEVFGSDFVERYVAIKLKEIQEFVLHVPDLEKQRYIN